MIRCMRRIRDTSVYAKSIGAAKPGAEAVEQVRVGVFSARKIYAGFADKGGQE